MCRTVSHYLSIILVPGVGTLACDSWSFCNQAWTDALAQLDIGITMHSYDYDASLSDHFSWQHLLDEGAELLSKLRAFLDSQKVALTFLRSVQSLMILRNRKLYCSFVMALAVLSQKRCDDPILS